MSPELEATLRFAAYLAVGLVVVVGGVARLRGRRSRLDRIGDALGRIRDVDGLPSTIVGSRTDAPPPPDATGRPTRPRGTRGRATGSGGRRSRASR